MWTGSNNGCRFPAPYLKSCCPAVSLRSSEYITDLSSNLQALIFCYTVLDLRFPLEHLVRPKLWGNRNKGIQEMFKRLLLASAVAALATGCASSGSSVTGNAIETRDLNEFIYLRGVFTWWDAEPEFKVKARSKNIYCANAELVADGEPYEFKFADKDWTTNCGFLDEEDEVVQPGRRSKSNCQSAFNNFKFTPEETGNYAFCIDVTKEIPEVFVEKAL